MQPACMVCLMNQILRLTELRECDRGCAMALLKESARILEKVDTDHTPPEAAAILYPAISRILGEDDPYRGIKEWSVRNAGEVLPRVRKRIEEAEDPLGAALRAAVAGNVIDFAAQRRFGLDEEIETAFSVPFAIDECEGFRTRLQTARRLAVIADNVGEHLFDALLLETVHRLHPDLSIDYLVRGRPIINDIDAETARHSPIPRFARIVDTGVDTPAFLPERANAAGLEAYEEADLILSKGMGNYECLEGRGDERIFFLFKVKCEVVAAHTGTCPGDWVCIHGSR
ncbi:damage-control phosphatase ARMT1 family protein [Nitratifractor sp.]